MRGLRNCMAHGYFDIIKRSFRKLLRHGEQTTAFKLVAGACYRSKQFR